MNRIRIAGRLRAAVLTSRRLILLAAALLLIARCTPPPPPPPPPGAHNVNYRMCVRTATGVPYDNDPPAVDGTVLGDLGYTHAFRYTFGNGSSKAGALQAIRSGETVYLSFEIDDDATLDEFDRLILVFDPDGVDGNYRMLQIQPFETGTAGSNTNQPVFNTFYWTGTPGSWSSAAVPASVTARVSYATAGPVATWSVELSFDRTQLGLPSAEYFGLYADAIVVDQSTLTAQEYTWPDALPLTGPGGPFTPEVGIPDAGDWGNASLSNGAQCFGVYFAYGDIRADPPPEGELSMTVPNTFRVDVYNTSQDGSGTFIAAPGVRATFRIANFGLGNAWGVIPVGNNPTPATLIPAAAGAAMPGTATLSTNGWNAGNEYESHLHQCVLVELDSDDPSVTFVNRSTWRNMNFQATSSPFAGEAVINTAGYELPEGEKEHVFLLTAEGYNTPLGARWRWVIDGAEQIGERTYRVTVPAKEDRPLKLEVEPPPDVRVASERVALKPGTGAEGAVQVRVRPGSLVTLVARGSVLLEGDEKQPASPNGVDLGEKGSQGEYLLGRNHAPGTRVGALVGSWDGFRESGFVVGSGHSVKVPAGVEVLSLAINDTREGLARQQGDGFEVQVVQTPVRPEHGRTSSLVGRDPAHEFVPLPLGINLPSWRLCGKRRTGRQLLINEQVIDVYEDAGCFGYLVNEIGR